MVMIKLTWNEQVRINTEKNKRAVINNSKLIDLNNIIEKAILNSNIETVKRNFENKNSFEEKVSDFEFHEQFFS